MYEFELTSISKANYFDMLDANGFKVRNENGSLYIALNDIGEMVRLIKLLKYQLIIVDAKEIIIPDGLN